MYLNVSLNFSSVDSEEITERYKYVCLLVKELAIAGGVRECLELKGSKVAENNILPCQLRYIKNLMKKDIKCLHFEKESKKSSFYIYPMLGYDLCLCKKCERVLRKNIFKQNKIEEDIEKSLHNSRIKRIKKVA